MREIERQIDLSNNLLDRTKRLLKLLFPSPFPPESNDFTIFWLSACYFPVKFVGRDLLPKFILQIILDATAVVK